MGMDLLHSCSCSSQQTDNDVHAGALKYAAMLEKGERDYSVKHDFPPTKTTWLKLKMVKVDYHWENMVKIPPFLDNPWRFSFKKTPFYWNPYSPSRHTLLFTPKRDKQPTCGVSFRGLLDPKKWFLKGTPEIRKKLVSDLQMTSKSKCIGS